MYHQRLFTRLERQRRTLRSAKFIEDLGSTLKVNLQENAPTQTGTLIRNLGTTSGVRETAEGLRLGYGQRSAIGPDDQGAPRGTIKAFLRDFPEFKRKWSRVKTANRAWWALPQAGKEELQRQRQAGRYGGESGVGAKKSPYLYPQSGAFPGWQRAAAKASISSRDFIETALADWREYVPSVISAWWREMNA